MNTTYQNIMDAYTAKEWAEFAFFSANIQHVLGESQLSAQLDLYHRYLEYAEWQADFDQLTATVATFSAALHQCFDEGAILVSFHIGQYRLIPLALLASGYSVCIIVSRDVYAEQLAYYKARLRADWFANLQFVLAEDPRLFFQLRQYIHRGYLLLCYVDGASGVHRYSATSSAGAIKAEEQQKVAEMVKRFAAEEEKERYEYAALAAQVSPHMMANIFQGWSSQLACTAPGISRHMMNVYGLMKFYMQAHEQDGRMTILLHDEIQAVTCFVEAQREMQAADIFINWDLQGNLYRFGIPPTTILTLVKNAFKHGDIYDTDTPLTISVEVGWSHYRVQVWNKKLDGGALLRSHGQGLRNLKKRLDMVFGERAQFDVTDTETMYSVELLVNTAVYEGGEA